jgi:transposase
MQLTENQRHMIRELYIQGCSYRFIARILHINHGTVQHWCNLDIGIENKPRKSGVLGKRKIGKVGMMEVDAILNENPKVGTRHLRAKVVHQTGVEITDRTLRNYQKELGYKYGYPRVVPLLTLKNKEKRLLRAKKHKHTDWSKWIFSDESLFDASSKNRKERYKIGQRRNVPKTRWMGKVHYWLAIRKDQIFGPEILKGSVNSHSYCELLKSYFSRYKQKDYIFQDDNATAHSAHKTTFLKTQIFKDFCDDWPPQSPDLNPTENLFGQVNKYILERDPKGNDECEKYLKEAIKNISQKYIKTLILSMPNRIKAVINAKGGNTKY